MQEQPLRLGVALGGGAFRGLAHIGVLQALEKHGLAAHEGSRWYLTEQGFLVSNSIINAVVEAGE